MLTRIVKFNRAPKLLVSRPQTDFNVPSVDFYVSFLFCYLLVISLTASAKKIKSFFHFFRIFFHFLSPPLKSFPQGCGKPLSFSSQSSSASFYFSSVYVTIYSRTKAPCRQGSMRYVVARFAHIKKYASKETSLNGNSEAPLFLTRSFR